MNFEMIWAWIVANWGWLSGALIAALGVLLAAAARNIQKYAWLFQLAVTVIEKIAADSKNKAKTATDADDKEVATVELATVADIKAAFTAGKVELSPASIAIAEEMISDVSAMIKEKKNPNRDKSFFGFLKVLAACIIPGVKVSDVIKPKE